MTQQQGPVHKSLFNKPAAQARPETFAMEVLSYDTKSAVHTVTGRRIDNNEEVVVFLRDDPEIKTDGKYGRPAIAAFAKPRKALNDPSTSPGGTLVIQDARKLPDGSYGARWIMSASHNAEEGEVFIATVHMSPVLGGQNGKSEYQRLNVLYDFNSDRLSEPLKDLLKLTPPFKVENIDDLRDALTEALETGLGAGFRLSTPEAFDGNFVLLKSGVTPQQAVAEALNRIPEELKPLIGTDVTAEVIPYRTIFAGPATRKVMMEGKREGKMIEGFNKVVQAPNKPSRTVGVYKQAIVAVRKSEADANGKRSVYFTMVEPLMTRAPVEGLNNAIAYAQTEHLAPKPVWPNSNTQASTNEAPVPPAAESFDGSGAQTDDDIMGSVAAPAQAPAPAPANTASVVAAAPGGDDDMGAPIDLPTSEEAPIDIPPAAAQPVARAARRFGARA